MIRLDLHRCIPLLVILSTFTACMIPHRGNQEGGYAAFTHTNRLMESESPYLRRNAHQAINWYPWGGDAFDKAFEEQKLLVISLGYMASHSCHEMDRETFGDSLVAGFTNEHFVSIKVDIDERPDIYQLYLKACHLMSKYGCGTQLNMVALPDGRPIFIGSYYTKLEWENVLHEAHRSYSSNPDELRAYADEIMRNLETVCLRDPNPNPYDFSAEELDHIFEQFLSVVQEDQQKASVDAINPYVYQHLLSYIYLSEHGALANSLSEVLEKYTWGRKYDHIGGGFFHAEFRQQANGVFFEKMLNENARMISLFSEDYRFTQNPEFERVVFESIGFIEREMTDLSAGYYAALDAESESIEGRYYTWTQEEIDDLFGRDAPLFSNYFNVEASGNWKPGASVLFRDKADDFFALRYRMDEVSFMAKIDWARELAFRAKKSRARPMVDTKHITAWNAQMLSAYVEAYRAIGEEPWLVEATRQANFIWNNSRAANGGLYRIYYQGNSYGQASLDDYACTIEAFSNLYQMSLDEKWLERALSLMDYVIEHFEDKHSAMFFLMPHDSEPLLSRQIEGKDDLRFASNSSLCNSLLVLAQLGNKPAYTDRATQMLHNIKDDLVNHPTYYANWASAYNRMIYPSIKVEIDGDSQSDIHHKLAQEYLPHVIFSAKSKVHLRAQESSPSTICIYRNKYCHHRTTDVEEALLLIEAEYDYWRNKAD